MAVVRIDLDVDPGTGEATIKRMGAGVDGLGKQAQGAKKFLSSMFEGIGIGAGMQVLDKVVDTFKASVSFLPGLVRSQDDYVSSILKTEAALGLTARAQTILQRAGQDAMVSWEAQTGAIVKLAKVLNEHPEKLQRLGLSYDQIKTLAPEKQYELIGTAIAKIEDPMRRAGVATEFFGKSGAEVIPVFTGAIEDAEKAVDSLGLAISEQGARNIDDLNNTLDKGDEVWAAFERNIAAVIASSEPLQKALAGLVDLLAWMSRQVTANEKDFREWVDGGVVFAMKALLALFDLIQGGMDLFDVLRIAAKELYVVFLDLGRAVTEATLAYSYLFGPALASVRDELRANITMMASEQEAARASATEIIDSNIKRTNALQAVRAQVEALAKSVEGSVGVTHEAAAAEVEHARTLVASAAETEKATAAAKEYEAAWLKANNEIAQEQAERTREWQRQYKEQTDAALRETERLLAEEKKSAEEEVRLAHDAHEQVLADWEDFGDSVVAEIERQRQASADAWADFGDSIGGVMEFLDAAGLKSDSTLAKIGRSVQATAQLIANATARGYFTIADLASAAAGIYKNGSTLGGVASGAMIGNTVGGPIGALIGGALGGVLGLFGGRKQRSEQRRQEQQQATQSAVQGLDALVQRLDAFRQKMQDAGVQGVNTLMGYLASKADVSAERLQRMGAIGFGAFELLRKGGMSAVDAMNALGPSFDAALKNGAERYGAQFAELAAFRKLILDNQDLVNSAEQLGSIVQMFQSAGMLTQETFSQLASENSSLIDDMLAQGFTLDQALEVNKKSLYAIYKAQQDLGLVVDETTQKYIDQALTKGLFDDMKDPMEELVEIQKMMLEITAALARVFGAVLPAEVQKYLDKLNKIPSNVSTNVNTHYTWDGSSGPGTPSGEGGDGLPQYARGGISTSPHVAQLHGSASNPELVAPVAALIRGIGDAVADRQAGTSVGQVTIVVNGASDPATAAAAGQEAAKAFIAMVRDNVGGTRRDLQRTLGLV